MLHLVQDLKKGEMRLIEVPLGRPSAGQVQVKVYYSVISAGTEGRTVRDARASMLGKAKSRPTEVKKVLQMCRNQGIVTTYGMVRNKLSAPNPLGYSCCGEVIAIGSDIRDIKVGDLVACGGNYANHAEVVTVPKNLCAKLASNVDPAHACLSTVAAIALQGIRQADLRLGEFCCVIGLGLIGQLTILLLKAAGVHALGVDIDKNQVEATLNLGDCQAMHRTEPGLESIIHQATRGHGADAVIITAATSSLDPIEFAGNICRKKGKVIIVGAVPTGFSRTNYYRKELELRMSSSYGPGRYDPIYEEKGIDYPIGYVRWTEQRNMQAFLDLLSDKRIDVAPLITHVFPFNQALDAYKVIVEKTEPFTAILFRYNIEKQHATNLSIDIKDEAQATEPQIGLLGAGNFAQNILLPALKKSGIGMIAGLAESQPTIARYVAEKYGIRIVAGESNVITNSSEVNTIFIATRHYLHGSQVLEGLRAGKHIFVEKPLCMNEIELEKIADEYNRCNVQLMVGYNRRFAKLVQVINEYLPKSVPRAIMYRINAGQVPPEHWVHDLEIGGGRILGEVCHFIDLAAFISGSHIVTVQAETIHSHPDLQDTAVIQLSFSNGSVASICYFSNGNKAVAKEKLEVFCSGTVAQLDDFQDLTITTDTGKKRFHSKNDKGHAKEILSFLQSIKDGKPAPIAFSDIHNSMLATFKVLESIQLGQKIILSA